MEFATVENAWVNTIDSKAPEVVEKARFILKSNLYCTLSTCSTDGYPWVTPVFFVYDDRLTLYWCSTVVAKHSQNLYRNNGRVAVAVFNSSVGEGTGQGLYFYGVASEVSPSLIQEVMGRMAQRAGKVINRTVEDYLGDSPRRIYQFHPQEAWITGDRLAVDNQLVDTKIQVDVADIIKNLAI
jgi:uncharacterized protein YhbP (UPF0306 family)